MATRAEATREDDARGGAHPRGYIMASTHDEGSVWSCHVTSPELTAQT
jgi:hypothetical protein